MEDKLKEALSEYTCVETDVPMSSMTTLHIGGNAKYVILPASVMELDAAMKVIRDFGVPYKVFGKGSNLLCSDEPFEGVVIRFDRNMHNSYFEDCTLLCEAGCSLIALAHAAMKHGLSGLEFASGIPATVGGAAFMNAGAYKRSMSDVIESVFVYRDGRLEWISCEECGFSYRTSVFQSHPDWIITGVRMKLTPGNADEIFELMEDRKARRLSTQPLDRPSAGSVFRNPESVPAWKLIEGIGYRGKQVGGARVSEKHVNFIVNEGGAKAADYISLADEIREKVKEVYGIDLHMEVEKFNWD